VAYRAALAHLKQRLGGVETEAETRPRHALRKRISRMMDVFVIQMRKRTGPLQEVGSWPSLRAWVWPYRMQGHQVARQPTFYTLVSRLLALMPREDVILTRIEGCEAIEQAVEP